MAECAGFCGLYEAGVVRAIQGSISQRGFMFTLSERFERALSMACDFHRRQKRKNLPTPFISHPLSVAALVCENIEFICEDHGQCEDFAMIAVLHDAIEDQGGMKAYDRIAAVLGKNIADGVMELSDSACAIGDSKPPKTERNAQYYEKIARADLGIVLISCCDKIHNLRSMAADDLYMGEQIWESYTLPPRETIANYARLLELYRKRLGSHRILGVYERALDAVRAICPNDNA